MRPRLNSTSCVEKRFRRLFQQQQRHSAALRPALWQQPSASLPSVIQRSAALQRAGRADRTVPPSDDSHQCGDSNFIISSDQRR